jgi:hypothetical protein
MKKIILGLILLSSLSFSQINNSSWDGSVQQVKEEIIGMVNDPESVKYYEWGIVTQTEDKQITWCNFGAKNGYGGMVRMEYWFIFDGDDNYIGYTPKED